jgi:hypothetical protein
MTNCGYARDSCCRLQEKFPEQGRHMWSITCCQTPTFPASRTLTTIARRMRRKTDLIGCVFIRISHQIVLVGLAQALLVLSDMALQQRSDVISAFKSLAHMLSDMHHVATHDCCTASGKCVLFKFHVWGHIYTACYLDKETLHLQVTKIKNKVATCGIMPQLCVLKKYHIKMETTRLA